MNLRSKILYAINKGLNEALNLDDFSEDDLKIQKKSLSQTILNSNFENKKYYYQDLMNLLMSKNNITREDILQCIDWYKEYNVLYNPHSDGADFRLFIYNIIKIMGYTANLNWIDTSEVTDMSGLFYNSQFNGDISEWNVSSVTDMSCLFGYSEFNGDISLWNVSNVIYMSGMFLNCAFDGDIFKWDVSNVKDMSWMFHKSLFNGDISEWDVSNVTTMNSIFFNSEFNGDISEWDISNVKDKHYMYTISPF